MTTMPKSASRLVYLSRRLAGWIPPGDDRLLWLSNWETYPAEPLTHFETLRLGICGEPRHLIDAPGHLFAPSSERDDALLAALLFLVMAFNWQGYLVGQSSDDFLYLGDEFLVFTHSEVSKMAEVNELISGFHLEIIKNVEEAWK